MQPLPSPFQETLSVRTAFIKKVTITAQRGPVTRTIEPQAGSITQDSRRSLRWNGSLSLPVVPDLLPTTPGDLLTPFGTLVSVRLGVILAAGVEADVPYGRFMVDASNVQLSPDARSVELPLVDLGDRLAQYRFERPLTFYGGTDIASVVNTVVQDRLGTNPVIPLTGIELDRRYVFGLDPSLDPWRELHEFTASFGYRVWYDRMGSLRLDQNPDVDPLDAIPYLGPLVVQGSFDHRPPNVIVVRGEASDTTPPIQAVVMDTDSSSPTYAGAEPGDSTYGRITQFFSSPLITTVAEASQAGRSILNGIVASAANWTVSRAYDPTVDCDDLLLVPLDEFTQLPLAVDAVTVNIAGETTLECRAVSEEIS